MRGTVDPERPARIFKDHENFMMTDVPNSLMVYEVEERIPFRREGWSR
jgi:hypothetical protein